MKNIKKIVVLVGVAAMTAGAFARPHGGPRPGFRGGPHFRPAPVVHHHHPGGAWGRGGRNFWPGFIGGVVGGALVDTVIAPRSTVVVETTPTIVTTPTVVQPVVTTPVVVQQPVTTVQNVWVDGRYVDQVQPNGTVVRVWQAGHYEQRTVTIP